MSKLRIAVLAALVLAPATVCLPAFLAERRPFPLPAAAAPAPADLPPGAMQETARNACLVCHDAGIIVQQRLSKDAWGKEVDKMVRWGTVLDPKDRDPLVDYLATNFPPDRRSDPPAHVAPK